MANKVEPKTEVYDFKTVALGFDKQAVIKYIGSLSKKMKAVEEEREEKIHELEAKLEKALEGSGEFLAEERENELQEKIEARDASIISLNKEIEILKNQIAQKEARIKELEASAANGSVPVSGVGSEQADQLVANAISFAQQLINGAESYKKSVEKLKSSASKAPAKAPVEKPAPKAPKAEMSVDDLIITENVIEKGEDLVASEGPIIEKGEDLIAFDEPVPEEKGDDLGNDLYEMLIEPSDADSADLSSLLADQEEEDIKLNKSLEIQPADIDENLEVYGEFSDLMAADTDVSTEFERDDDVFNFAFAEDGEEDDDDMSTDATPMNNLF